MNKLTKDATVGASVGLVIGAACGAVAGYAGLMQLCNNPYIHQNTCEQLISDISGRSIQVGCGVGAAVGSATLCFMYSAFKAVQRNFCQEEPLLERNRPDRQEWKV